MRAAETETEEDVDVEEEAVSMLMRIAHLHVPHSTGIFHMYTVHLSLQLADVLIVPGLDWCLDSKPRAATPSGEPDSLSSSKQHGCVRQLCFIRAQLRLCTPTLDRSCAHLIVLLQVGAHRSCPL